MKKIAIIAGIIMIVIVCIVVAIFSVLNKEKTPISSEEFKSIMEGKSFTIIDVTQQFVQYKDYMLEAYIAQKDDYQIEFYKLSSGENAVNMYETNKAKFETQKGNNATSTNANMKNYSTYSLNSNGKYKYISRIDDTFVYVDVDENNKEAIRDIIKEIGY